MVTVTIYENLFSSKPHYISLEDALERIRTGKSKSKVEEIRRTLDKEKAKSLKQGLPCIRFSGKFSSFKDESLIEHNGFMILDFDDVYDVGEKMAEVLDKDYTYAAWVSPSGTGVKALVRIADGSKHRQHFEALKCEWPELDENGRAKMKNGKIASQLDKSGINVSRICFESYDPSLTVKPDAVPYTAIIEEEQIQIKTDIQDNEVVFLNLLKWITNRGDAFVSGERNHFLFKLAAACCRFGLDEDVATSLIVREFKTPGGDCTVEGFKKPIKNAYKANRSRFGTAKFEREVLIDKQTRKEIDVQHEFEEVNGDRLQDVVYGIDMKQEAINIFMNGYPTIVGIGVYDIDRHWKPWRKEITLLSGHGNYGKSAFEKWYLVFRAIMYDEKIAVFAPEDKKEVYYHELTEILMGMNCAGIGKSNPKGLDRYLNAYDFISAHFFYIFPEELSPTPEYIKRKFLELIIKEGVDWCVIDPFNQMFNDYGKVGNRDDKYLEIVLADFKRFAMTNEVFFLIVAHPKQMGKGSDGNYPCPDVYDLAGGAIWNAKMDNILIYHRPFAQTDPNNPTCEFHAKKIKDPKVVGEKGFVLFELNRQIRRYSFGGHDPLGKLLVDKQIDFKKTYSQQALLV